jgi:hypothetical protein
MTDLPTLSHRDYAVGWICALPTEMAAAQGMLDERHSPLPFKDISDEAVSGRYHYGELRLTRLNLYIKILLRKFEYERVYAQYGEYFCTFLRAVAFCLWSHFHHSEREWHISRNSLIPCRLAFNNSNGKGLERM